MKYSVLTFGCRVNQADSLAIEDAFLQRGAVPGPPVDADVVVVNTCSVTASADQGARQAIRRIARSNPRARIVATGCYASRCAGELSALPSVVQVVPNREKDAFGAVLDALIPPDPARYVDGDGPCGSSLRPGAAGRTAFTLRVQTGCDERCAYCIIPSTRGPGRSKALHEVVTDVNRAVAAGYREIAVTGVHLGSWGRDLGGGATLEQLLEVLARWPDDVLFRVSSLEPMDCTDAIVDLVAGSPRLAPHFHLPLQHGSDRMLRAMHRPYTAASYVRLVQRIHQQMPWAAVGTDVIVGFPGELDADMAALREVLRDLPTSHLHVFPYSDRPGTEASRLGGKVDGAVVRARATEIRGLGAAMVRRFRAAQAGSRRRALVVDDGWSAVTDNYLKVRLDRQALRNDWVDVRVDDAADRGPD